MIEIINDEDPVLWGQTNFYQKNFDVSIKRDNQEEDLLIKLFYTSELEDDGTEAYYFSDFKIINLKKKHQVYDSSKLEDLVSGCAYVLSMEITQEEGDEIDKVIEEFIEENEIQI